MHTLPPQTAGQLPFDRSWFLHVNELARDTPWLHAPARGYASYGVVLFAGCCSRPGGPPAPGATRRRSRRRGGRRGVSWSAGSW